MNRDQRNIHKWTWLLIALVVPVISFLALRGIDGVSTDRTAQIPTNEDSSFVLTENQDLGAKVEEDGEGSQLMIKLYRPLKSASTLVYVADNKGDKGMLLGQLRGVGEYSYKLNARPKGIILYDAIKELEIEKLEFSWE